MVDRFNSQEQRWADEFARFKKDVLDRLENIDYDNFSPNAKKLIAESAKGRAGFEAYVDDTSAVARMFAEYDKALAKVEAIANNSGASIVQFSQRVSDLESSYSQIETSATNAAASASLAASYASQAASSVASISTKVDANGAFISLMASASNGRLKVDENGKPIVENGNYIYIDQYGNENPVSEDNIAGIYIEAINKGVYSQITSIRLEADVVSFGNYANVDKSGNFYAKRLWGQSTGDVMHEGVYYPGFFYAEVGSGGFDGDELVGANLFMKDYFGNVMYGFSHKFTTGENADSVNFVVGEDSTPVWGYNYGQHKFYPKGVWDFSNCDVENIPLYFS